VSFLPMSDPVFREAFEAVEEVQHPRRCHEDEAG
jgi:hypothetical protein